MIGVVGWASWPAGFSFSGCTGLFLRGENLGVLLSCAPSNLTFESVPQCMYIVTMFLRAAYGQTREE